MSDLKKDFDVKIKDRNVVVSFDASYKGLATIKNELHIGVVEVLQEIVEATKTSIDDKVLATLRPFLEKALETLEQKQVEEA